MSEVEIPAINLRRPQFVLAAHVKLDHVKMRYPLLLSALPLGNTGTYVT